MPLMIGTSKKVTFMSKYKSKAIVLRGIFVFVFLVISISMIVVELNTTASFLNSLAAFNGVIPSAAALISNINWFYVTKFSSKEEFAKWSVITFVIAYIIGIVSGFIYYEIPFKLDAIGFYVYQLGLGIILSVIFSIVIYLLSKVYFELNNE